MVIHYGPDAENETKVWVYVDNKAPMSYILNKEADVLYSEDNKEFLSTRKIVLEAIAGLKKD